MNYTLFILHQYIGLSARIPAAHLNSFKLPEHWVIAVGRNASCDALALTFADWTVLMVDGGTGRRFTCFNLFKLYDSAADWTVFMVDGGTGRRFTCFNLFKLYDSAGAVVNHKMKWN